MADPGQSEDDDDWLKVRPTSRKELALYLLIIAVCLPAFVFLAVLPAGN